MPPSRARTPQYAAGFSSPDNPSTASNSTSTSSFRRYLDTHPSIVRVAWAVAVLCLVIGLSLGLTRVIGDADDERLAAQDALSAFVANWRTTINIRFSEVISVATSAAMFAGGGATSVPNHNGTKAERMQFINNASWEVQGARLFRQVPGILTIELASSGVITQDYPPGNAPIGLDILSRSAAASYRAMVEKGTNVITGPWTLFEGGWGLLVRAPVYLDSAGGWENFWGSATLVCRILDLLEVANFTATFDRQGYDYTLFRRHKTNASLPDEPFLTSRVNASESVVREGVVFNVPLDLDLYALDVAIAPKAPIPSGNPSAGTIAVVVVIVLLASVAAAALVLLAAFVAHAVRHRAVPHKSPTAAEPTLMALVSVKSMTWWKEHADEEQLHDDLQRFEKKTAALASAHGCHASGRIADGCVLVVASDPSNLRRFATAVRSKLVVESKAMATASAAGGGATFGCSRSHVSHHSGTSSRGGTSTALPHADNNNDNDSPSAQVHFQIGVAMHVGPLRATYDAPHDHYTFYGSGIAAAARAVDATRGGEVSATDDFADSFHEHAAGPVRTECLDDEMVVYVLEASSSSLGPDATQGTPRGGGTGDTDGSAVATSLSAQTGTVLRKVVAVLVVELLPSTSAGGVAAAKRANETPIREYARVLETVAEIAQEHNGEIVSTVDATVTVLFNARVATSTAATRAVHTDDALRVALQPRGIRVVSVVATGRCHVATVAGNVMCVGAPMTRARRLHAQAVALACGGRRLLTTSASPESPEPQASAPLANPHDDDIDDNDDNGGISATAAAAKEELPMLRTCIVDAGSVEVLRQSFEVQCIGPMDLCDAGTHLVYAVEREWDDVEHGDDEWLYRLQQMEEQSVFSGLNAAFEGLKANPDQDEARAAAADLLAKYATAKKAPTSGGSNSAVKAASADPFAVTQLKAMLELAVRRPIPPPS